MSRTGNTSAMSGVVRLRAGDAARFDAMLDLFGSAFDAPKEYGDRRPGPEYRDRLLSREDIVTLVALRDGEVIGALVAYEFVKFERERSEFYIYDLAVREDARRRGVATGLIDEVRRIARNNRGSVVMIQADPDDAPAVALYTKLGDREDVLHFEISMHPP